MLKLIRYPNLPDGVHIWYTGINFDRQLPSQVKNDTTDPNENTAIVGVFSFGKFP